MAIGSNRIKTKSVASLVDKKFISVVDKTKDTPPNNAAATAPTAASSKKTTSIGKTSPTSPQAVTPPSSSSLASGDTSSPVASTPPPANAPDSTSRDMSAPMDINGASSNKISLALDSGMNTLTKGVPDGKVKALESMIHDRVTVMTRGMPNLNNIDKQAAVLKGIGMITKQLSATGGTLGDKATIGSLLTCVHNSGVNGDESSLMASLVVNLILTQALCMSPAKLFSSIDALVKQGTVGTKDLISGAISSFISSSKTDPRVRINAINNLEAHTGPITASISAQTMGMAKSFIDSLSTSVKSTNRTKDHTDTMLALDKIAPGWSGLSGDSTIVKNNAHLGLMSKDFLKSTTVSPANINADPTPLAAGDPKLKALLVASMNQSILA